MADEIRDSAVAAWWRGRTALPLLVMGAGLLHVVVFVYSTDLVENGPSNEVRSIVASYLRYALLLLVAVVAHWLLRARGYRPFGAVGGAVALSVFVAFAGPMVFLMLVVIWSAFG